MSRLSITGGAKQCGDEVRADSPGLATESETNPERAHLLTTAVAEISTGRTSAPDRVAAAIVRSERDCHCGQDSLRRSRSCGHARP
jgi:hypothetical protein